jgi:hypothetical protein
MDDGDDAADAQAKGWTATHIAELERSGELFGVEPEKASAEPPEAKAKPTTKRAAKPKNDLLPGGFRLTPEGVFYSGDDGEARPVCSPLEILARTRDAQGHNWGLLVEFDDPDGAKKRWNIPARTMTGDFGKDVLGPLVDMGLRLAGSRSGRNARNDLQSYLGGFDSAQRARLVTRLGWHDSAFLLPEQQIGSHTEHLHFYEAGAQLPPISEAGTLEQWQEQIGALCIGNHRLAFVASVAFAGLSERETLENSLPHLEATWRNAPSNYSPNGNMIGSPESRAAEDKLSSTQSRVRTISSELERIEQKLTHLDRLERVDQIKTESIQTMSESAVEVEALERTQAHLTERLRAIQSEAEQALEKAQQAERDAASLYARSLASGDNEGEKTANSEIQKAAKQLAITDEQVRRQELILTALQAELDTIETQISNAQQRGDEAKKAALNAIGFALDEQWNAATMELVAVGARILAVSYQKGGMGDALSGLEVPRFGPFHSRLDRSDLAAIAREISLADLLAA